MRRSTFFSLAVSAALLIVGLSAGVGCEGDPQVCDPGRADDCPCPGGAEGVQVCADDGASWGECECDDDEHDAGPGDGPDAGPEGCDGDTLGDPASPECDSCVVCAYGSTCADQVTTCENNPACVAFDACRLQCADDACVDQCSVDHPGGEELLVAVLNCGYCDACPVSCGAPSFCP
jgi:hypothetical protein